MSVASDPQLENHSMGRWLRDIWDAVSTVAQGMWVTLRYWFKTYEPGRGTFTESSNIPRCRCRWRPAIAAFIATI